MTIYEVMSKLEFPSQKLTVFELGAADGQDVHPIQNALLRPGGAIEYFAFEPDPRNVRKIRDKGIAFLNGYHLIEAAVGAANRMADFRLSAGQTPGETTDWAFSSSLKEPVLHLDIHTWCRFDETIKVRMMRLDTFCALYSIDRVDFIWADVQGAEDLMIEGAMYMLDHIRYLYSECYETEIYRGQIGRKEMLARLGPEWKIHTEWNNDVLFINTGIT